MDDPLRIPLGPLQEGTVVDRPNRFVAIVRLAEEPAEPDRPDGRVVTCHIADSGRLKELIFPGNKVMVRKVPDAPHQTQRKTAYDMVLAAVGEKPVTWVSVDTRYPTRLFGRSLRARAVPEFSEYDFVRSEYSFHHVEQAEHVEPESLRKTPRSRLDFYLEGSDVPAALVEVKSVTLCVDGLGLFPDAPTDRGARHLGELQKAAAMGYRAYAVFIAQREDIRKVSPNSETDPKFAAALKQAQDAGVRLLAYRCDVFPESITLKPSAIPVIV